MSLRIKVSWTPPAIPQGGTSTFKVVGSSGKLPYRLYYKDPSTGQWIKFNGTQDFTNVANTTTVVGRILDATNQSVSAAATLAVNAPGGSNNNGQLTATATWTPSAIPSNGSSTFKLTGSGGRPTYTYQYFDTASGQYKDFSGSKLFTNLPYTGSVLTQPGRIIDADGVVQPTSADLTIWSGQTPPPTGITKAVSFQIVDHLTNAVIIDVPLSTLVQLQSDGSSQFSGNKALSLAGITAVKIFILTSKLNNAQGYIELFKGATSTVHALPNVMLIDVEGGVQWQAKWLTTMLAGIGLVNIFFNGSTD